MARGKSTKTKTRERRTYTEDFKRDAVQLHLDGQSAPAVAQRLGLSSVNLLYRWKREFISQAGVAAESLEAGAATGGGTPARSSGSVTSLKKAFVHFPAAAGSRRLRSNSAGDDFSRGISGECGVSHIEHAFLGLAFTPGSVKSVSKRAGRTATHAMI
ncbi:MAG: transposase [Planctomycetaceae bacterium]